MAVLLFLYGFFLLIAFHYGYKLTGKPGLRIAGLCLGLALMFLSAGLHLGYYEAYISIVLLFIALFAYQMYYVFKFNFFPARVGLIIHLLIFVFLIVSWQITE